MEASEGSSSPLPVVDETSTTTSRSSSRRRIIIDSDLPSLPDIPSEPKKDNPMRGPIPTSNWVVPGLVIAGAYPGSPHEPEHSNTVDVVISSGTSPPLVLLVQSFGEGM